MIAYRELCIVKSVIEPRRGIRPAFTPYEVLRAITLIHNSVRGLGRPTLMRMLGLGEASTRTLLRRLLETGLIVSKGYGFMITERGKHLAELISKYVLIIEHLPSDEICIDCTLSGVVLREPLSSSFKDKPVLAIRDTVVREGAKGALVIALESDHLYLPLPGERRGEVPHKLEQALRDLMKAGDIAIISICDSATTHSCVRIAFNAVFQMLTERCGS